jgi:hypothetical protein
MTRLADLLLRQSLDQLDSESAAQQFVREDASLRQAAASAGAA